MSSFLITVRPDHESPDLGESPAFLRSLAKRKNKHGNVRELWRFYRRKEVNVGDRVFLVLQGKTGPAIIGYGKLASVLYNRDGVWGAKIDFEDVVDPAMHAFSVRDDLLKIDKTVWRTQVSGVRIPESVADALDSLDSADSDCQVRAQHTDHRSFIG